jgi:hypothetical protein
MSPSSIRSALRTRAAMLDAVGFELLAERPIDAIAIDDSRRAGRASRRAASSTISPTSKASRAKSAAQVPA